MSRTLFHYTPVFSAVMILREGLIRRSKVLRSTDPPAYVWLSSNPKNEPTACRVVSSREQTSAYLGRARFVFQGCDATPWADLRLTRAIRRGLERLGEPKGRRPEEWFALSDDVSCRDLPLEIEMAEGWQEVVHDDFLLQYRDLKPPNVQRGGTTFFAAYSRPVYASRVFTPATVAAVHTYRGPALPGLRRSAVETVFEVGTPYEAGCPG